MTLIQTSYHVNHQSEVKVAQSCLTLCYPMDYTVHGILQAGILEWVAVPFSRGSSQPRDQTQVSRSVGGFLTSWAMREPHKSSKYHLNIFNLEVPSSKSFISGLGETLDTICPGSELLSMCRRVKLAIILPALQTQWWNRITVTDISMPKVGKWKEERSHWCQTILKPSWEKYFRFQDLEVTFCGSWLWRLRLHSQV